MAIDLTPAKWFDENEGAVKTIINTGVAGTGNITIYSGDGTNGITGLDLTGSGDADDSANAARILKAILEYVYSYQEGLATADKPTTMTVTRSSSASGTTLYLTYSTRFQIDTATAEVDAEA
jgi:hypothetical protein